LQCISNDEIYEGEWQNNMRHGKCIIKYSNEQSSKRLRDAEHPCPYDIFEGEYINNKSDGKGIIKYKDGSVYTGDLIFSNLDKIFKKHKCDFELMHCISAYPFDGHLANLNLMLELKKRYGCKVGYSGHEKNGLAISYAAVALGASSLERHITLDRLMYGSDQSASLTPLGLKQLVGGVRVIEKSINGSSQKKILDIEKEIAKKLRAHIKIN
jgi:hypothetical protein